jgi:hypothetical protein
MNLVGLHEFRKVYEREENREKSRIRGDEKEILGYTNHRQTINYMGTCY